MVILGRMGTQETVEATDFEPEPVASVAVEAALSAPSDLPPHAPIPSETGELEAQTQSDPEPSATSFDRGDRTRVFGSTLRIEAAIDSQIASILPAVLPSAPPQPLVARAAPQQQPVPPPAAAAPDPRGAAVPEQPSNRVGGQGWIIETD